MEFEFFIVDAGEPLFTYDDLEAAMTLFPPTEREGFDSEFDKLAPWVFACQQAGLNVTFDDTYFCSHQIRPALQILRDCYGEISTRRPFLHPDDHELEPFVRMVKILETALAKNAGVVAYGP